MLNKQGIVIYLALYAQFREHTYIIDSKGLHANIRDRFGQQAYLTSVGGGETVCVDSNI